MRAVGPGAEHGPAARPRYDYNHNYWDWPENPEVHSHVRAALKAGYATFNVDRLGVGQSTKPASHLVTLAATIDTLHQVITQLRAGAVGGQKFSRVVYFGSSLSTAYGWLEASLHDDVDAFVLTGLLHFTRPTFLGLVQQNLYTVCEDPVFSKMGLYCGYITSRPGSKATFFYNMPNADQTVIDADEQLRDVISGPLIEQSVPLVLAQAPQDLPSRLIRVPTLVVLGEHDMTAAGTDGIVCTDETVKTAEAPIIPSSPAELMSTSPRIADIRCRSIATGAPRPTSSSTGLTATSALIRARALVAGASDALLQSGR